MKWGFWQKSFSGLLTGKAGVSMGSACKTQELGADFAGVKRGKHELKAGLGAESQECLLILILC